MATSPITPNPQASAPQPGAGASAPQGNPIKEVLGKVIQQILYPMAQQNQSIQEDLMGAIRSLVQAIQKSDQAGQAPPQQAQAPMQQ